MASRRSRGDGGLHWDEARQRWIATLTIGFTPAGKRIVRKRSGKTKTEAKNHLGDLIRDHEDGLSVAAAGYTVEQAVRDWLKFGLNGRAASTVDKNAFLAESHIIPALGNRRLRDLSAEDVDKWLSEKAKTLSTSTILNIRSILRRAVSRAQARDKVKRNVVLLCEAPTGQAGRPSKALDIGAAGALIAAAEADESTIGTYIVVSLLLGARTEELRALDWRHVDTAGDSAASPPVPPHIMVWRSVRTGGDTKTRKSRRTLALPGRCVVALDAHRGRQEQMRAAAGERWAGGGLLVFASEVGSSLDAANVRRGFRRVARAAGLDATRWTPRELRHSFVSLLSDARVPIEEIARLVGHSGTSVTEQVYRHQLRPVMEDGATAMDRIFPAAGA
ncbi:site-specific integrase [Pseudonocardia sp. D17]|uniref:site-specific integrase n=1 Tax=Pseudonocardia sp. D17 TaxID=882661 RepID=UPI002B3FB337|nr:integrase [Pseudonocardia sp. D17]